MGGEIRNPSYRWQVGTVRKRSESCKLNTFCATLKVKGLRRSINIATRHDVARTQPNINIFNMHVGSVEGCSRDHALEWFTSKFARSKAQISAATHRLRYTRDFDCSRHFRLSIRQLFIFAEGRNGE